MPQQGDEPTPARKLDLAVVAELVLSAAAPVTVVTALLVHVGSVRNRSYYGYFGVDQDLLRPSVQDYVLRSVDVTFGAVLRLVVAGLVLVVLDRVFVRLLRTRESADRLTTSLVAGGAVLSVVGLLAALGVAGGLGVPALAAAAVLAVGVGIVLRLGPSLVAGPSASLGRPTTIALYTVLVVALFWAASIYAHELGQRAARVTEANPAGLPVVTVFSEEYLDLPGDQVRATPVTDPDGHVHYRYSGMSLLTYSNGTWFLITGRYSDAYRPSVLVLPDTDEVRVEVAAPEPQDP